jgi:hypothetical protein
MEIPVNMEPLYMMENRYSYLVYNWRPSQNMDYEAETPETTFEWHVHNLFIQGQNYLHREEYLLAYNTFRDLQSLILKTVHPKMPVDPNQSPSYVFPKDMTMIDALTSKVADILKQTKVVNYKLPPNLIASDPVLPANVQEQLNVIADVGLQVSSHHAFALEQITNAVEEAGDGNLRSAIERYTLALEQTPNTDPVLRASLMHDLAVLNEQTGNQNSAMEFGQTSVNLFAEVKQTDAQLHALNTMVGVFNRAGKPDQAAEFAQRAEAVANSIVPVTLPQLGMLLGNRIPFIRHLNVNSAAVEARPMHSQPVPSPPVTRPRSWRCNTLKTLCLRKR